MFFPRDAHPDPGATEPTRVLVSQDTPEVTLERNAPSPARAAVAAVAAGDDRFDVLIAVRLLEAPGGLVIGHEGEPVPETQLTPLLEAAVTFAAGLGFRFDAEMLTGDAAAEAWRECQPFAGAAGAPAEPALEEVADPAAEPDATAEPDGAVAAQRAVAEAEAEREAAASAVAEAEAAERAGGESEPEPQAAVAPEDAEAAPPAVEAGPRPLPPARRDPGEAPTPSANRRARQPATGRGEPVRRGRVPLARLKLVKQRQADADSLRPRALARLLGSY